MALVELREGSITSGRLFEPIELTKVLNMDELFKGRHFDREIIVLCVRWYLPLNGAEIVIREPRTEGDR